MQNVLIKYSLLRLLVISFFSLMVFLPVSFSNVNETGNPLYYVAHAENLYCFIDNAGQKNCYGSDLTACNKAYQDSLRTEGAPRSYCFGGPITEERVDNIQKSVNAAKQEAGIIETGVKNAIIYALNFLLAALIALVGGILALVGAGFDEAIRYTVTDFSSTFGPISAGVSLAWSGFRDVANIVMIAMFVFVAFAVILNIEQYGLKRFGVRILVVAVLINFSLFFTKAIVDVSNVTATQFRNAIQIENTSGESSRISDIFLQKSGIVEFSYVSAKATLDRIGTEGREAGFTKTLLYTFTLVVFYSALIAVLLFGLILLVIRMVVLTVLMFTSALAFIAYLIPKYGDGLWSKWWNALIQNALFAPLFMMMIWATVNVISKLGGEASPTLDKLVENSNTAWPTMLNLMVVVGLLYASTKVANELSIKGAGFAKNIAFKGGSLGLRAGGAGVLLGAGLGARNILAGALARGFSRVPGLRGLGANLDKMSQNKHINNTLLGKKMSKAGLSFGADNNKAIAEHMQKLELEKAKGAAGKQQEARLETLEARKATVADEGQKSKDTRDELLQQASDDLHSVVQQQRETNTAITDKGKERSELVEKRDAAVKNLRDNEQSMIPPEVDAAKQKIQESQNAVEGMDAEISKLRDNLSKISKNKLEMERDFPSKTKAIRDQYDPRIARADKLEKKISGIIASTKKDSYVTNAQKDIAKESIDRRKFTSKSVKEMAKKGIGKSDIDKIADAINKASDKSEKVARQMDKKEASRDAKKDS